MNFKEFWKLNIGEDGEFTKSADKLSKVELTEVQQIIHDMQKSGKNASKIIKYLQDHNHKLINKSSAERAYYTERKRMDTLDVIDAGESLDLTKYRVLLSPHACPVCVASFKGKTFDHSELKKNGVDIIPRHPNCYCCLIPI
jgi:hypothetical protein